MSYGVTPEGFSRPTFEEIRSQIIARYREIYGPINTGPESGIAQQISDEADRENAIWDAMEAVHLSQYPRSAAGLSLDGAVQLTGISRLPASRATVTASLIAEEGRVIPEGTELRIGSQGETFATVEAVAPVATDTLEARIEVAEVVAASTYTVTLSGQAYSVTTGASPSRMDILEGLQFEIDDDPNYDADILDNDTLRIIAADRTTSFSVVVSDDLELIAAASQVEARALEPGRVLVLSGTLNTIATPVAGLIAATNYFDGQPGRDVESDTELRLRQQESLLIGGRATAGAIRSRLLQNVEGVSEVIVRQNTTLIPVDDISPHNIEVVVSGGLDADVAQEIWNSKAAGIGTSGEITEIVTDDAGRTHGVLFSRPVDLYIWMRITLRVSRQRGWPLDGPEQIRQAVANRVYTVGQKVLRQELFCDIYDVPGVLEADIRLATSPLPTQQPASGSYAASNIEPSGREVARLDPVRVEVIVDAN